MEFIYEQFTPEQRRIMIEEQETYIEYSSNYISTFQNYNEIQDKVNQLKNLGYSKFIADTRYKPHNIIIVADENFKFICRELKAIIPKNMLSKEDSLMLNNVQLYFNFDPDEFNRIHFTQGLPDILKGIGLGYNSYKICVKELGYISSMYDALKDSINVWYKLICDADFYAATSKTFSIIIDKKYDDIENLLIKLKQEHPDLIYDELLKTEFNHILS